MPQMFPLLRKSAQSRPKAQLPLLPGLPPPTPSRHPVRVAMQTPPFASPSTPVQRPSPRLPSPPLTISGFKKFPTPTSITIPPSFAPTHAKPSRRTPASSSNIPPCASRLRVTATTAVPPSTTSLSVNVAPMPSCSISSASVSRKAASAPLVGAKKSLFAWKLPKLVTPRIAAATLSRPSSLGVFSSPLSVAAAPRFLLSGPGLSALAYDFINAWALAPEDSAVYLSHWYYASIRNSTGVIGVARGNTGSCHSSGFRTGCPKNLNFNVSINLGLDAFHKHPHTTTCSLAHLPVNWRVGTPVAV